MKKVRISIDKLKAFGEASFSEELAFNVASDSNLTVLLLVLLFNESLLRWGGLLATLAARWEQWHFRTNSYLREILLQYLLFVNQGKATMPVKMDQKRHFEYAFAKKQNQTFFGSVHQNK